MVASLKDVCLSFTEYFLLNLAFNFLLLSPTAKASLCSEELNPAAKDPRVKILSKFRRFLNTSFGVMSALLILVIFKCHLSTKHSHIFFEFLRYIHSNHQA